LRVRFIYTVMGHCIKWALSMGWLMGFCLDLFFGLLVSYMDSTKVCI
jgi:hypothetical protein